MNRRNRKYITIVLAGLFLAIPGYAFADITGRVVDSFTGKPILGAIVTSNGDVTQPTNTASSLFDQKEID